MKTFPCITVCWAPHDNHSGCDGADTPPLGPSVSPFDDETSADDLCLSEDGDDESLLEDTSEITPSDRTRTKQPDEWPPKDADDELVDDETQFGPDGEII